MSQFSSVFQRQVNRMVKLCGYFDGTSDPISFLRIYMYNANLIGWSVDLLEANFKYFLTGRAKRVFDGLGISKKHDLLYIMDSLEADFNDFMGIDKANEEMNEPAIASLNNLSSFEDKSDVSSGSYLSTCDSGYLNEPIQCTTGILNEVSITNVESGCLEDEPTRSGSLLGEPSVRHCTVVNESGDCFRLESSATEFNNEELCLTTGYSTYLSNDEHASFIISDSSGSDTLDLSDAKLTGAVSTVAGSSCGQFSKTYSISKIAWCLNEVKLGWLWYGLYSVGNFVTFATLLVQKEWLFLSFLFKNLVFVSKRPKGGGDVNVCSRALAPS